MLWSVWWADTQTSEHSILFVCVLNKRLEVSIKGPVLFKKSGESQTPQNSKARRNLEGTQANFLILQRGKLRPKKGKDLVNVC